MAFYSYIFSANYKRFFRKLKNVSEREGKNIVLLTLDTVYCVFRYGFALSDYLNYKIYNKNKEERKKYLSTRRENKFYEIVSPSEYKQRYTIKPNFLEDFKKYTKRDFFVPQDGNYQEFLNFLDTHEVFMSKPYDGLGGADVKKVYTKDIENKQDYFYNAIHNRIFLEELVIQHPVMNDLCSRSVNTMRIITFNNYGRSRILWMCLRVGNGVNAVDNFHANGMIVNIDMDTGRLVGNAIDRDLKEYAEHPITHARFDGFQIPYFEEAKKMVLSASMESDKILVVGWDVAISENGPVIIEGNRRPGFDIVQVLSGGRADIVDNVLADVKRHKEKMKAIKKK